MDGISMSKDRHMQTRSVCCLNIHHHHHHHPMPQTQELRHPGDLFRAHIFDPRTTELALNDP